MCEYHRSEWNCVPMKGQPLDILGLSLKHCLKDELSYFFKSLETTGQGKGPGLRLPRDSALNSAHLPAPAKKKKNRQLPGTGLEGQWKSSRNWEELVRVLLRGSENSMEQLCIPSRGLLTSSRIPDLLQHPRPPSVSLTSSSIPHPFQHP